MRSRSLALVLVLLVGLPSLSLAQETAEVTPKEAARVETATRVEPIAIGFEDLAELELQLEQMRQRQRASRPGSGGTQLQRQDRNAQEADEEKGKKGQRTIVIDVPIFGAGGASFRFVDVTLREELSEDEVEKTVQSMQQRRLAVEQIRRELAKKKSLRGERR